MTCIGYVLRADSEGSLRLDLRAIPTHRWTSTPTTSPRDYDRATAVGVVRAIRRLFATGPLAGRIERETQPGPGVETDEQILDDGLANGTCGFHTIGTCAMGPHDDDVVDPQLRVRGVRRPARGRRLRAADHGLRQPQRTGHGAGLASRRLHQRTRSGRASALSNDRSASGNVTPSFNTCEVVSA